MGPGFVMALVMAAFLAAPRGAPAGDHWFSRPLTTVAPGSGGQRALLEEEPHALLAGGDRATSPIDLTISLYADPTGDNDPNTVDDRTPYEQIIGYYADAVFEASNGVHKVRQVRIYRNSRFADKADVVWAQSGWPCADAGGWGVAGKHTYMYDVFDGTNFLSGDWGYQGGGYTLAHEWGHYGYGLYDEYRGTNWLYNIFSSMPHTNDDPVVPSIMNSQWNARGGDYKWLNFSIGDPNDGSTQFVDTKKTAQHRMFDARGWETLVRPTSDDPRTGFLWSRPARTQWTDLVGAAPVAPAHWKKDLPSPPPPKPQIIWMESEVTYEIVIDHSGSMCGSKLDNVKTAAALLVDVTEPNSAIGVVKFDDDVTIVQSILKITSQADKDGIKAKIAVITCDGYTAIGDAAQTALSELQAYGSDTDNKVVFLLSDGESNTGSDPLSVIPAYQAAKIPIFAFGYGDYVDDRLRQMAEQTGGKYYYSPTTLADITKAFADANQQVSGSVGVGGGTKSLPPSASDGYAFTVDPSLTTLNVVVTYNGAASDALVKLLDPFGVEVPPSGTSTAGGSTQVQFSINDPADGVWQLTFTSQTGNTLDVSYNIDAAASDALTYSLSLTNLTGTVVQYPDPVLLVAVLQKDRPIGGAVVTATVTSPDGTVTSINLRDDGQSPDVTANDGHYSAILSYQMDGVYNLFVKMDNSAHQAYLTSSGETSIAEDGSSGSTPDTPITENFERTASLQVAIQGVVYDDHGNTPAEATAITADNSDTSGRIDYGGDVDVFSFVVPPGAAQVNVRVTEFAPGMDPKLTLIDSDGTTELATGTLETAATTGGYLLLTASAAEGTTLYAAVAHTATDGTGTYRISAGPVIGSDQPDSDGDTVPDSEDVCPGHDDLADRDHDGTPDGCDECPDDPAKTEPGVCGCGEAETDTDEDSTPDCKDDCPEDPDKTAPGVCDCGTPDNDSDSDGAFDCEDDCPNDPDKTSPGVCGCGTPDDDSDHDSTLDCQDDCPDDPDKTSPGVCGCGTPDEDSDGDGTLDCQDDCPDDPNKTAPGECGCGESDEDSDSDGTLDCHDGCAHDPKKTAPGECGCGHEDGTCAPIVQDSDGDGVPDSEDGCPHDPDKTAPGACGCGTADVDTDGDGVADCIDNCPDDPNPDQADADGDGTGDVCGQRGREAPGPCGGGACGGTAATMIGLTLLGLIRARRGTPRAR
jgi:calcium-activated chloride channel regulator 4